MKTIKYSDIVVRLNQNLIEVKSDIKDDEEFSGINSLLNAQKEDISFFSNIKYVDNLKICKAKAC